MTENGMTHLKPVDTYNEVVDTIPDAGANEDCSKVTKSWECPKYEHCRWVAVGFAGYLKNNHIEYACVNKHLPVM